MMMQKFTGHRPLLYNASAMCKHTEFRLQSVQTLRCCLCNINKQPESYISVPCTLGRYLDSEPDRITQRALPQ